MKHVIIGTAGHVDHGKTALVKALTGVDCDRLKEEKERGLTIELGYASLYLGDGKIASIVDVPGHERFVKTMIAGAGIIDCVLFVIAADDGVMPQTIEHFDIINLLGIKHGLIVLTKVDLVNQDWLRLVKEDIARLVRGTAFENVPIVQVSSVTGEGIQELKDRMKDLAEEAESRDEAGIFRFPVDWTFKLSGIGAVVCGVIFSGKAHLGDRLELLPQRREVRVRGIQVHGEDADEMRAGQQVAVSLSGVSHSEIKRGDVLSAPGYLEPTYMLDARLRLLGNSPVALEDRTRVRLHLACSEVLGRIVILDREKVMPGEDALVQFRLEEQITAEYGDRYVIRQYSPMYTIGGGMVLDASPQKHKKFKPDVISYLKVMENGSVKERLEQLLLRSRTQAHTESELVKSSNIAPIKLGDILEELIAECRVIAFGRERRFMHAEWYNKAKEAVVEALRRFHAQQPLKFGMSREGLRSSLPYEVDLPAYVQIIQELISGGVLASHGEGEKVRLASHEARLSDAHESMRQEIERIFLDTGLSTPLPENVLGRWSGENRRLAEEAFDYLVETGVLVQVDEKVFFHKQAVDKSKDVIIAHIRSKGKLTLSDCRELFQVSRKYMLPLLYHFDKVGVTLRIGDDRVLRGGVS